MHRAAFSLIWISTLAAALFTGGCASSGVGDPCIPESVPCSPTDPTDCKFSESESYVEASSVQCRTRTCIVHKLEGNPEIICDAANPQPNCVTEAELNQRVFCTCRCDGPRDANFEYCSCPSGFICEEVLALGGDGITGSYCVKPEAP